MNEASVQLVEKANFIMEGDCSIAIHGYDSMKAFVLLREVSSFSSQFSRLREIITVSITSLPTLSCLNGATEFSLLLGSDSGPTASQSATPATGATSVVSDGAPILAVNAGIFALGVVMLL